MKTARILIFILYFVIFTGCTPVRNPIVISGPNIISQKGGYAVKTDDGIFCIDNKNIYQMKNDGALVWVHRIPEVKKIVPSYIMFLTETSVCALH